MAPPFYFVSLPIATLIVGMEMLAWIVADIYAVNELSTGFLNSWLDVIFFIWDTFWSVLQLYPVNNRGRNFFHGFLSGAVCGRLHVVADSSA